MKNKVFKRITIFAVITVMIMSTLATSVFAASTPKVKAVISSCDSLDGWGHLRAVVDKKDKKEGKASFSQSGKIGEEISFWRNLEKPIDLKITEKTGAIELWLYVKDVNGFRNGDLEFDFSSSGGASSDMYSCWIHAKDLKNGWNKVTIKLTGGKEPGNPGKNGNPNLNKINFYRLFTFATKDNVVKIDGIRAVEIK